MDLQEGQNYTLKRKTFAVINETTLNNKFELLQTSLSPIKRSSVKAHQRVRMEVSGEKIEAVDLELMQAEI